MADDLKPPAPAGGNVVAGDQPCLTGGGGTLYPDSMPRSKDAIERGWRNQDATRPQHRLRVTDERAEQIDKLRKRLGLDTRAGVIYAALDALEEKLARARRR